MSDRRNESRVTMAELAAMPCCVLSRRTLVRMCRDGRLWAEYQGNQYVTTMTAWDEYLRASRQEATA